MKEDILFSFFEGKANSHLATNAYLEHKFYSEKAQKIKNLAFKFSKSPSVILKRLNTS